MIDLNDRKLIIPCDIATLSAFRVHLADEKSLPGLDDVSLYQITWISKIELVVYYQCCVLIGWAIIRLYVIAH